jgi:D-hexose-6-phosphate mutarotase
MVKLMVKTFLSFSSPPHPCRSPSCHPSVGNVATKEMTVRNVTTKEGTLRNVTWQVDRHFTENELQLMLPLEDEVRLRPETPHLLS